MAMGGIPQYLKHIGKGESANQAIDKLCFDKNGMLRNEFHNLYRSLFNNASHHESIVRALAKKPGGMSRAELLAASRLSTGGGTTRILDELEQSGFISAYVPFKKTSRDCIYKLADEYSLFFLKFIERSRGTGKGSWQKAATGQSYKSWCGLAFESVCQKHVAQIMQALGIAGVHTEASAWRYTAKSSEESGAQIDLLLDRQDRCINVCEMKFSSESFVMDKKYASELDAKIRIFKEQTQTRKTIFPTLITTYPVKQNEYYTGRVQAEINMDSLFI